MNKLLILIIMLVSPYFLMAQEKLGFISENIDFSITSSLFTINGIYVFANGTKNEIRQTILFPFSNQSDSIHIKRVYNVSYNENLPYKKVANGIVFKMNVIPHDTVNINISYSQRTEKENIYILESTQTWDKPLHKADYSLTIDNSVTLDSVSLKPDKRINNVYYWTKTNFYPNDNFILWIE
jgi:hypothetical protein